MGNSEEVAVVGTLLHDYSVGDNTIAVQYKTTEVQKSYVGCQVGGLSKPNFSGCLAAAGTLKIEGVGNNLLYTYDPKTKNINMRTIKGFSKDAVDQMYRCENCPYET